LALNGRVWAAVGGPYQLALCPSAKSVSRLMVARAFIQPRPTAAAASRRGPPYLLWAYTSRMASMTVSGASNWTYSELLGTKICFALEQRV